MTSDEMAGCRLVPWWAGDVGGACGEVRRRIAAGREGDDDVVGLRGVPAGLPAQRREVGDDLGELFGVVQGEGEETLVQRRPAHWPGLAVVAGDPHRDARPLDRPGQETHAVDRVVL